MLVDDLTLIKEIGKGAFSLIYLASKQGSQEKFAVKVIDKRYIADPRAKKFIDREITILKEIDHLNIIKLYEVKEINQNYYLIMEYCNGDGLSDCLEYHLKNYKKPFSEEVVQYLMRQIISGISYLHGKHILHRDIKLDNILVKFDSEEDRQKRNMLKAKVRIIDFGFARYLDPNQLAYTVIGSPLNMEPGIIRKLNRIEDSKDYGYNEKADIWSLGSVCYEMLTGKCAFDSCCCEELLKKIEIGFYLIPISLSKEAASFLIATLQYDPKKRFSIERLSCHKFLTKDYMDFTKMDLTNLNKYIDGNNIRINTKKNDTIWDIFEEGENLDDTSNEMVDIKMPDVKE